MTAFDSQVTVVEAGRISARTSAGAGDGRSLSMTLTIPSWTIATLRPVSETAKLSIDSKAPGRRGVVSEPLPSKNWMLPSVHAMTIAPPRRVAAISTASVPSSNLLPAT
jgi:hypothetical protein